MKFSKYSFLVLFVGIVGALPLRVWCADTPPQAAGSLSLDEAIRQALEVNPGLRAAVGRVEAAVGRAEQARRWSNPELEVVVDDWPLRSGRGLSDAKRTIGLSQTVPFLGKKSLDRQLGGAGVKLSDAELVLHRLALVREVKMSFFSVLAAERLVEESVRLVTMAEASVATARKRVEAGAAAYQEQLRAEVQMEQVRSEQADFHRALDQARQSLAALLDRTDLHGVKLLGALTETPDLSLLVVGDEERLARHPSMRAAQATLDRAELGSRRARLESYPDVKIGVAGGQGGEAGESIGQVSFSVPLPILDRGKGLRQEARANVSVATAELHFARQQLRRDWINAVSRYRTVVEQVGNFRERILPKAIDALRLVQSGYEQGKFNFTDLIDTQRTTAQVRMTYQEKLLEMNLAQVELETLMPINESLGKTETPVK